MVKVVLDGDLADPRLPVLSGPRVALADDLGLVQITTAAGVAFKPAQDVSVNPVLTVRERTKTGLDDDGLPRFTWRDLVTGEAILWSATEEFDPIAGAVKVKAKATILYDGPPVSTSVAVRDQDGNRWAVSKVGQFPDRLELIMSRVGFDPMPDGDN